MKIPTLLAALGIAACTLTVSAAPAPFPAADLMQIGVYYYPEAWPSNQSARDIGNIKKLNMEFVHMGEFAWAFMEPEEGRFDFNWLDRNVQLCAEQGLKVVLCTDGVTPTPGSEQYSQAAQEISPLRKNPEPDAKEPAAYAARRAALLYNVESRWDIDDHKQTVR